MSQALLAHKPEAAAKTSSKAAHGGLRIGAPDDAFEREADRVAEKIMSGGRAGVDWSLSRISIAPPVQRKCSCGGSAAEGACEECSQKKEMQRKEASPGGPREAPSSVHRVLNSSGAPLDSATRSFFAPRLGCDFSQVRVHTDAQAAESARAVNALAYTVGNHIVFGAGRFDPAAPAGRQLLAHELAHVRQQSGKGALLQRQPLQTGPKQVGPSEPDDCEGRVDITREFKDFVRAVPGLIQSSQDFAPEQKSSFQNELNRVLAPDAGVDIRTFKVISCDKINTDLLVGGEIADAQVDPSKKEIRLSKFTKQLMDDFKQKKDKVSLSKLIETLAHEKRHVTLGRTLKADPKAVLPGRADSAADKAEYRAQEILAVTEEIAVGRMAFGNSYAVPPSKQENLRRQSNMIRNYVNEAEYKRLRGIIIAKLRERYGFAHGCDNALTLGVVSSMDHNRWFQCVTGAAGGIVPPVPSDLHICDDFCKTQGKHSGQTESEEGPDDEPKETIIFRKPAGADSSESRPAFAGDAAHAKANGPSVGGGER